MRAERIVFLFVFLRIVEIQGVPRLEGASLAWKYVVTPSATEMLSEFQKSTETVIERSSESNAELLKVNVAPKDFYQTPKKIPAKTWKRPKSQNDTIKIINAMHNSSTTQTFISSIKSDSILQPTTIVKHIRSKKSIIVSMISESAKKAKRANWHYIRKNFGPYMPAGCQIIKISGACGTSSGDGTLPIVNQLPTAQSGLSTEEPPESISNDLDGNDHEVAESANPLSIESPNVDDLTIGPFNTDETPLKTVDEGSSSIDNRPPPDLPSFLPDASSNPQHIVDTTDVSGSQIPNQNSASPIEKPDNIDEDLNSIIKPTGMATNLNSVPINDYQETNVNDEANEDNDEENYEDNDNDAGDNNAEIVDYIDEHGSTPASEIDDYESEEDRR